MRCLFSRPPWTLMVERPGRRRFNGSVMVAAGGTMAIDCTASGDVFSEAVANGKLIAAAPALAAELDAILFEMESGFGTDACQHGWAIQCTHRDVIRRLLQEAGLRPKLREKGETL